MAFTYLLGWKKFEKYYYGVRYGKDAFPDSLGTTYWSSSQYVKEFITKNGLPDIVEIRKIFISGLDARIWEMKVLKKMKVISSEKWLNQSNNYSFKGVIMTTEIKHKISFSKKGKKIGKYFTNGILNIFVKEGEVAPDNFINGRCLSEAQKKHIEYMNKNNTYEKRIVSAKKCAEKTRGVKKPKTHGENVSKALRGKKKPWNIGENNVSKRPEVREKISKMRRGKVMFTNGIQNIFSIPGNEPKEYWRGRTNKKL